MQHRVKTPGKIAVCGAVVATMSLGAGRARGPALHVGGAPAPVEAANGAIVPSGCPADTLPDGDACVRLPDLTSGPEAESSTNTHRDRLGRWIVYDDIPRRPDRSAEYDAYRYPVPCEGCVGSGFDLDRADALQRRGRHLRQVGHGAVDLLAPRGTPVTALALDHQEGDAEVVYVGPLFGTTVVTRHALREGGRLHDYLVLFGHLDAAAPGIHAGASLHEGDGIGLVGDSGSPGIVHLHLEVRRLRDARDTAAASGTFTPQSILDGDRTVVCDPRNVLPLR